MLSLLLMISSICFGDTNKVLIIGIDGCRPDALLAAKTPNIDKCWCNGAFSFHAETDTKTKSGPCWTSMLTGVWSTKHGILNNSYSVPSKHPHFFQRLKILKPGHKTASIVQWEPIHTILPSDYVNVKQSEKTDSAVVEVVAKILSSSNNPDAVFVQLDDVDHAGHAHGYGPHVSKYLDSIESSDKLVGKIIDALTSRDSYEQENWLIIISTDHGGIRKGHGGATAQESTVFFIAHGRSVQNGELPKKVAVVDVAVTAMAHLGITIDPKWNMDGKIQGTINTQQKNSPDKN
jgi:predicted AlkP superfamily pyrophosphatase or phosphodiesterase